MTPRLAFALLPLAASLAQPVLAQGEEPFGPNVGAWRFTQAVDKNNLVYCRAIYKSGAEELRFGRISNGNNWINTPATTPSGKIVGASLSAGNVREQIVHPMTRSNGSRLWLEGFDAGMFNHIAKARGFEWRVGNTFHVGVSIDGNGAAVAKRLSECLAANAGIAAAPAAAKPAAAPAKARMLYPDGGGLSQSCVVPMDPQTRRYKLAAGAELMLANATSGAQCSVFQVSAQRIAIAGQPNLCVNIGAGSRSGNVYLEACNDVSVTGWDIAGNATTSARVRAVGGPFNNQCWAVPGLADPNVKFPTPVVPADCKRNAAQELKFFVE